MDEKAQKEALKELNKSLEYNRKRRFRIIFSILIIYLFLVFIYQYLLGSIIGTNPDLLGFKLFPIGSVNLKEKYDIKINNSNNIDYFIEKRFSFPLIPLLINIEDSTNDFISNDNNMKLESNNKNIIQYKVYKCFSDYNGVYVNETCDKYTKKYEEVDIKHKIKIIRDDFPDETILYDGKYIEDISEYLKEEGKYNIYLYYRKLFTTTKVRIDIEVYNDKENK